MLGDDDLQLDLGFGRYSNDDVTHAFKNIVPADDLLESVSDPVSLLVVRDLRSYNRIPVLHDRAVCLIESKGKVVVAKASAIWQHYIAIRVGAKGDTVVSPRDIAKSQLDVRKVIMIWYVDGVERRLSWLSFPSGVIGLRSTSLDLGGNTVRAPMVEYLVKALEYSTRAITIWTEK